MKLNPAQKRALLEDGYLVAPGLVPRPLVDEALREINHRLGRGRTQSMDVYADARDYWSEDTDDPAIADLLFKGGLWDLAQAAVGTGKLLRPNTGQIALRFPSVNSSHGGPAAHVDGFYSPNAKDSKISRFTMLAGVMLSDMPRPYMGNLAVYPGTHKRIAQYIAANGAADLRSGLSGKIDLGPSVQLTGKAGDCVLLHYQLAHDKEQNLSPQIRYMAYWRLWHVDAEAFQAEGLTDIWREWPEIAELAAAKHGSNRKKGR